MTYRRFEELPVWNGAVSLALAVFELCEHADLELRKRSAFKPQLERAAVSVSNNIAEGFERGTTKELISFLYIARGSAGEVRSMLCLLERMSGFHDFKSEISNLKSLAEQCSRQLRAWADSLQNSDIKGERHLNDRTREADRQLADQESKEFDRKQFAARASRIAKGEEDWQPD